MVRQYQHSSLAHPTELPPITHNQLPAKGLDLTPHMLITFVGQSQNASQLALMLFRTVDRDNNGTIDLLEFYQWLLVFKYGNFEQKCRFGFDMIDQDGSGMWVGLGQGRIRFWVRVGFE